MEQTKHDYYDLLAYFLDDDVMIPLVMDANKLKTKLYGKIGNIIKYKGDLIELIEPIFHYGFRSEKIAKPDGKNVFSVAFDSLQFIFRKQDQKYPEFVRSILKEIYKDDFYSKLVFDMLIKCIEHSKLREIYLLPGVDRSGVSVELASLIDTNFGVKTLLGWK